MKKIGIAFLLCCLAGTTAHAEKPINYQSYSDSVTGRTIEYFDMGENTAQNYVTQNAWFSDNKSFVVGTTGDSKLYKYDTLTHKVEQLFDDMQLIDNCAYVDPTNDTVYAKNNTSGFLLKQSLDQLGSVEKPEKIEPLTMTIPLMASAVGEEPDLSAQTYSDPSGLSFKLVNNDRWNDAVTVMRNKGGKLCRSTVARNTTNPRSGDLWYDIYTWNDPPKSKLRSSFMTFTVDSSKISSAESNITIEFDYYDDGSDGATSGQYVQFEYLSDTGVAKEYISLVRDNSWKTAKIELTDAKFDHRSTDGIGGADFRIGLSGNRGGFASTWIKVYPTEVNSEKGEISFEVNSNGTAASGELELERWSPVEHPDPRDSNQYDDGNYPRAIMFNGESVNTTAGGYAINFPVLSNIDGKAFIYNVPKVDTNNSDWKYWRNSFYFDIPNGFLSGSGNYAEVEIEYYAPEKGGTINFFASSKNGDTTEDGGKCIKIVRTVDKSEGSWKKISFVIPKNISIDDAWRSSWCNAYSNIKIMPQDLPLYIHKVTVKKYSDYDNLGYALGSWLPHVGSNGDISLITGKDKQIVIYEADNRCFAAANVYANVTHGIINPKYPNLVLYNHEGTAERENNRIWVFDRNEDVDSPVRRVNVFDQYNNSSDGATTGEAIGHEDWTPDGEHIVAVKYAKDTNIGKNGIVIMNKDGSNRKYINDDYAYLHCNVSPDGKWIVADTEYVSDKTNIVLVNIKTGKSYLVARPTLVNKGIISGQEADAHPAFNLDGTKITFAAKNPSDNTLGIAMVDVSDIIALENNQIKEYVNPFGYQISAFSIGFNKDSGKNAASLSIENIDGETRDMTLYAAVYDADGKLVSLNEKRYNSSESGNIEAEVDAVADGETVKCFLWDSAEEPVKNSTSSIKELRAAKVGANEIVLSWLPYGDMKVSKYEVFRGNTKIGETPYTVYKDTGLTKNTEYTYYVRPVCEGFTIGETGNCISIDMDDVNFDGMYCTIGHDVTENGVSFWNNIDNVNADSFTKATMAGGESCRQAIKVKSGETVSTPSGDKTRTKSWDTNGAFFFGVKDSDMTSSNVLVGVRYYDSDGINTDNKPLYLEYVNTDGATARVAIVPERKLDNKWKNATIVINDAVYTGNGDWGGFDFKISGGYNTFINRFWVLPLDENGNIAENNIAGNVVTGAKAGIKVSTVNDVVSATLTKEVADLTEDGLSFVWNSNDNTQEGYTESKAEGGRQNTSASTSKFCFNIDKDIIPEDITSVDVTVEYWGYKYEGGKLQLFYTATDGTTKSIDVATMSTTKSGNEKWKTATVSITDAKFIGGLACGSDFYLRATKGGAVKSVSVTKKSTSPVSSHQFVEWVTSTGTESGLTRISGGAIDGDLIYVATENDWLKFSVEDAYQSGKSRNMAWVEVTYKDLGTSNIYLYYNTSDPTTSGQKADKLADTVITCTDSGEIKTAVIPVIDANFSNFDGYDFRIGTDNGVYIEKVAVIGY